MGNRTKPSKRTFYELISAFLGWLGAIDLLFIVFYMLSLYLHPLILTTPPTSRLAFQVYFASILTVGSAAALVIGSYLVVGNRGRRGGTINLLAGTLVPVPTYIYFTFLSQPSLLGWIEIGGVQIGWALLAPAIISGTVAILASKCALSEPKHEK